MTQKKKNILLVFLFFSVAITLLVATENLSTKNMVLVPATAELEDNNNSPRPPSQTEQEMDATLESTKETFINSQLDEKIKSFPQNIQHNYRQALQQEPHQTPEIVMQTAIRLGEIFDSVNTELEAQAAFQFFAKCVTNESEMVTALQTSCYRFAKDLAVQFPSLQKAFAELENKTSDTVLQIVKFD
jgi:hypothetical protein